MATLTQNVLVFDGDSFASGTLAPSDVAAPGANYCWEVRGPGRVQVAAGAAAFRILLGGVVRWVGSSADTVGQQKEFILDDGVVLRGPANGALTFTGANGSCILLGSLRVTKVPLP